MVVPTRHTEGTASAPGRMRPVTHTYPMTSNPLERLRADVLGGSSDGDQPLVQDLSAVRDRPGMVP